MTHKNRQNGGFTCSGARLTFKMGRFSRSKFQIIKNSMDYSTRRLSMNYSTQKLVNWGVYLLRCLFDHENRTFCNEGQLAA
ncbi:hypothetical protein H5410_044037 [Solanum commersonii]|uniref:Uncharacterized protein n=1 Tax=Solanum commersonii TaxID=4109 RepID=A0A9J5XYU5_SOLCO|nr:hypothetical protein H5410_044037 [Solanum commersonii]